MPNHAPEYVQLLAYSRLRDPYAQMGTSSEPNDLGGYLRRAIERLYVLLLEAKHLVIHRECEQFEQLHPILRLLASQVER